MHHIPASYVPAATPLPSSTPLSSVAKNEQDEFGTPLFQSKPGDGAPETENDKIAAIVAQAGTYQQYAYIFSC